MKKRWPIIGLTAAAIIGISIAAGHGGSSVAARPVSDNPYPAASSAPASSHAAAPVRHAIGVPSIRVLFTVMGAAPNGADITYGSNTDNRAGRPMVPLGGGGDGWVASMKWDPHALYYFVNAQLNGGGDITAKVYLRVTVHFSDGMTKTRIKEIAHAHASGGYEIALAESH